MSGDTENLEQSRAWYLLTHTDQHVFLSGSAGTGKSTLLRRFMEDSPEISKIVLAPTGVAAVNVSGMTIHKFMHVGPATTPKDVKERARSLIFRNEDRLYRELDTIVIDEISMVRADVFDQLDLFLRVIRHNNRPFGGVRIVAIGDLYQLPPVVSRHEEDFYNAWYNTPFFFGSDAFYSLMRGEGGEASFIELRHIYRQTDRHYIDFLQKIRNQEVTPEELAEFNRQNVCQGSPMERECITLTARRNQASWINHQRLNRLSDGEMVFYAHKTGKFPESFQPTESQLVLKRGAKVMMLNNDSKGRWINGTMGVVYDLGPKRLIVAVEGGDEPYELEPYSWEVTESYFNDVTGTIEKRTTGTFLQYPVKLAWAVTIHKAQGQTFDELWVDLGDGAFASGQTYVALSRGTNLSGLHLATPVRPRDIICNQDVLAFNKNFIDLENGERRYCGPTMPPRVSKQGLQETLI